MFPQTGNLILDRYRLERPLASGAMGDVWAAKVVGTRDKVAVKLARGQGRLRAAREADALASMDHPCIVRHIDHGVHDDGFALVMELIDGVPLSRMLKASPPEVAVALRWGADVADALAHAHAHGVIHRDVKASNILVVKDGKDHRVVLIDFGIGIVEGGDRVSSEDVVLGSAHTMPPEQMLGTPVGPRSDLYSLGALLFRMVTGRYPFHAASQVQVLAMHAHTAVPGLDERADRVIKVPPGLEDLLRQCLGKAAEERPESADALAAELRRLIVIPSQQWIAIQPKTPAPLAPTRREPATAHTRPRWLVPALGVALAVALLAALWLSTR